ncbi:lutropin-choriogonadotropic hormone receptor-like [Limanda limanda]|uniref:lutropin-choriogonadotropic hormone receptor-like n=1 Tax=Limanda limanda TaxID=27771 RepID=UPI0029C94E61|nr:lutropin-choriogonadotropic hormone receptor-like [Limanda limanda]
MRLCGLLAALCWLLDVRSCESYRCPSICLCSPDTFQCSRDSQLASGRTNSRPTTRLRFSHLPLEQVPTHAFKELINITVIEISQSDRITQIQRHAFLSLHSLAQIFVQNINSLRSIEKGAFTDLPKLEYLTISNTGMTNFPDFTTISSLVPNIILEMADNMRIHFIPANSFQGFTDEYLDMNLVRNGFKEINSHAFNGTKLNTLILRDNRHLRSIQEDAFEGATGPTSLDVSSTALSSLPAKGLRQVGFLKASSTFAMKSLPPLDSLSELVEAEFTYPSHCCAFQTWRRKERESALKNSTTFCDLIETEKNPSSDGVNPPDDINFQYHDLEINCLNDPVIKCTPKPDAFNPCEDLLGFPFLRCLTWIISFFSVTGNLAVLVILLISHRKLTISRFLMCNLAFADLCMGLYLMLIACMDHYSRHEYYNHATDWQLGPGCGIAGFLIVFAGELSVYTLTVISIERWHTIINAMHVNKRLRMHHVTAMMGAGWGFSLLVALLPLVGVSSYSKVSICLPMDIDTPGSQVYVVAVLVLNVVAFAVVCYCYICIYLSVHNPEQSSTRRGDTKIAKRMAVLIFTDFICMAPISFFAISAALRMPLITVSHSKILLILFYPINSLCNPFLYTIFTRAFRRDMRRLLSRCFCCEASADFYRSQTQASNLTCTDRKPPSHSFYAYHIKMKGCFLDKGTT